MNDFSIGKTVELVSGGPVMTVKSPGRDGRIICQWFAGKKLDQGEFPIESLKPVPPPQPVPLSGVAIEPTGKA